MVIELGLIQLSQEQSVKRLKQDLKDDWFPDSLRYEDMIVSGVVLEHLKSNFESNHGHFIASERHIYNIPKANFTLRYALETGLSDRLLYHAVTTQLIPFYDPLIPWNAFSHRIDKDRSDEKNIFKNGVRAWQDFVVSVRSNVDDTKFLLSTDLSNFYESINLKTLKNKLISLLAIISATGNQKWELRACIDLLFAWLEHWAYDPNRGLPQNRDASSFLANIYMHSVDTRMIEKGYQYFRYMDDIKIVCKSEHESRKALKELSLALREIGASINSKKTKIINGKNLDEVEEHLDVVSSEVGLIDSMWKTRRPMVLTRSFPLLKDFTIRLIQGEKTESREFRYCIKRLETLALCDEFKVPEEYFSEVTPFIIESLSRHPASTDQFVRYLAAVPLKVADLEQIVSFICNEEFSIYSWQNYRVWQLLTLKKYHCDCALDKAKEIILNHKDTATRAGATLYLGSLGGQADRELIAKNFKDLESFQGQRSALIAIHELKYRPIVEDYVKAHLRGDLHKVFKHLQTNHRGQYHLMPEKVPFSRIVNMDVSYE